MDASWDIEPLKLSKNYEGLIHHNLIINCGESLTAHKPQLPQVVTSSSIFNKTASLASRLKTVRTESRYSQMSSALINEMFPRKPLGDTH